MLLRGAMRFSRRFNLVSFVVAGDGRLMSFISIIEGHAYQYTSAALQLPKVSLS